MTGSRVVPYGLWNKKRLPRIDRLIQQGRHHLPSLLSSLCSYFGAHAYTLIPRLELLIDHVLQWSDIYGPLSCLVEGKGLSPSHASVSLNRVVIEHPIGCYRHGSRTGYESS